MDKQYKLRYLPLFRDDLERTVLYIAHVLQNPDSAAKLIDEVEKAINDRLRYPLAFEPYHSIKKRRYEYYKIPVGNYFVFYVVIEDVMEVRRFVYARRDLDRLLP